MSLAPFNAAISSMVDLATVLPLPSQILPRELPQGHIQDGPPPRFTYDPITYYEVHTATYTLVLDSMTLIPHANGSTRTSYMPFKTTIAEPYTLTLTKPTDTPTQPANPSAEDEGSAKKRQGQTQYVEELATVSGVTTVTIYSDSSPAPVTQQIAAIAYPVPSPLTTEWHLPELKEEHPRAEAAAAAVAAGTKKSKATLGVQRHTPRTPGCAAPSTTCTVTLTSTRSMSVPVYTPLTSYLVSTTSETMTVPSSAPPLSTFTTSASTLCSWTTDVSSLATTTITTTTYANESASSAATTTLPSATPTPSISNAGAVGGGGKGGAVLAALWGLLASVGVGFVG